MSLPLPAFLMMPRISREAALDFSPGRKGCSSAAKRQQILAQGVSPGLISP